MTSDTTDEPGIVAVVEESPEGTEYEKYLGSLPPDVRNVIMERHTLSSRVVRIDVMHSPDHRKLCRECGRLWPCRTYLVANGREDA